MLKISVVSYLNSKPFIYGFNKTNFNSKAAIELDIPSVCADKLLTGKVDIGLVPVAILPKLKDYFIISDYCIGANGPVDSVLLLSNVPLNEIKSSTRLSITDFSYADQGTCKKFLENST
ncbi:MAG: hypothetical protein IPN88_01490 [Bacteroidetes bacterium]|nr:hypothetical protein [Bacteroidota bacterium]